MAFLRRAVAFYRRHGMTVRELLTDNGSPYIALHLGRPRDRLPRPWAFATCGPDPRLPQFAVRRDKPAWRRR
jgi:hypothetical protein